MIVNVKLSQKEQEIYDILYGLKEISLAQYKRLEDVYGKRLVVEVIKKIVLLHSDYVERFLPYVSEIELENDKQNDGINEDVIDEKSSYDLYIRDISELDRQNDDDKQELVNEIVVIIKELNELFVSVGCTDLIFGKLRKPWICDKVNYCIKHCSDKEVLGKIRRLYDMLVEKRNILLEGYLCFVIAIAKYYYRTDSLPLSDLIQYGNMGLIRAIELYDPEFNAKFITYAKEWINQSIIKNSKKTLYGIRKPMHLFSYNNDRIRAINELYQQLGREPNNQEIADYLGVSIEKVKMLESAFLDMMSIDEMVESQTNDGSYMKIVDIIADDVSIMDDTIDKCIADDMRKIILENLTEKEQLVIKYMYNDELTTSKIALIMGISRQRISQIHNQAIKKLRKIPGIETFR